MLIIIILFEIFSYPFEIFDINFTYHFH